MVLTADTVQLGQRTVQLRMSRAAEAALARRDEPLVAEMELYFSCLIRKRVRFPEQPHADALCAKVSERLVVCFRPVMTRACSIQEVAGKPELDAFPIRRPEAFIPKSLSLDYHHDTWSGEFGF
jgi:hypothetical protein